MRIIKDIFKNINPKNNGIISIGYFDSVHLGHIKLLQKLINISKEKKLTHYVLTFSNIDKKEIKYKKILDFDDKLQFIKKIGINNLIISDFSNEISKLDPEYFLKLLKDNFRINEYVISKDFHFGYKKKGRKSTLEKNGCIVNFVEPYFFENKQLSTSFIKELLVKGEMDKINHLLGRFFYIKGIVKKGKQIGRIYGFPTMNITNENVLYPKDGVYITKTIINNKSYNSMSYVAFPVIESNLLNYNKFHYDFKIKVDFFKKIRDNKHFKNNDLLKEQLTKDLKDTIEYFNDLGEVNDNNTRQTKNN